MATLDTEIRKLQPVELCGLAQILNHRDSWKKVMANVVNERNENVFNNIHFAMIEETIHQQKRSGADIFLDDWSTLGRKRPTCRTLLDLLVKTELFRAADYLAVDILKGDPPKRPKFGPAAAIDPSEKVLDEILKKQTAKLKTECKVSEPRSWSFHFAEEPITVIAGLGKQGDSSDCSDLMKFSSDKSDLMKFSDSGEETLENIPEQLRDLMRFSSETVVAEKPEVVGNYVLREALSADIPLCVKDDFQTSGYVSMTKSLEYEKSIESTDMPKTRMSPSGRVNLPNVSQNVIPVVVLEYNEKDEATA